MNSGTRVVRWRGVLMVLVATVPAASAILWYAQPFSADLEGAAASFPDEASEAPALLEPTLHSAFSAVLPKGHPALSEGSATGRSPDAHMLGRVDVEVALAGDAAGLPGTARIYVFLRVPGRRMPLAVEQFELGALPGRASFVIDDPGIDGLQAVARLSLDGDVRMKAGNAEAVAEVAGRTSAEDSIRLVLAVPSG